MKKIFFVLVLSFINCFIWADSFDPALWQGSWYWVRFNDGHWMIALQYSYGLQTTYAKVHYWQRGNSLYGYNSRNGKYDKPEGRILEETSEYVVVQWYADGRQERMERIKYPVDIYGESGHGDYFIGTMNAAGDKFLREE